MEVTIYKDSKGTPTGFRVLGHAGYARKGRDIVCSAVSVLTQTTVNAIETFTEDPVAAEEVDEKKGYLLFKLGSVSQESKLLLDSLVLGLQDIQKSYGRYVSIQFEEE